MKKTILLVLSIFNFLIVCSCSEDEKMKSIPYDISGEPLPTEQGADKAVMDIKRSMAIVDSSMLHYFKDGSTAMSRYYNPYTNTASSELGSVWMYTSAIEAVNSVMEALKNSQSAVPQQYADNFNRYAQLLEKLYDGLDYYKGSFTLTSYTQTKKWTAYAVARAKEKGQANMEGVLNVYDDQEWLIREMLRSYRITGKADYLAQAEYLTDYVLDGWDCYPDADGNEYGGITWGPGYVTKHSCSNGPLVSSLVWLYEAYRTKDDKITYRKIDTNLNRYEVTAKKADYYLEFAKKIYAWQKRYLMMPSGVYYDLVGATANSPQFETVNGIRYRKGLALTQPSGTAYTYNSGTMLSGCSDLYRVTRVDSYADDAKNLVAATFSEFAKKDADVENYYSYPLSGFSTWFNDVLLRGYLAAEKQNIDAKVSIESYQNNLDYAWAKYRMDGILPVNLLLGWNLSSANNNVEAMFSFSYASEYAMLANYQFSNTSE